MIDVEMVIHVVVMRADELVVDWVFPAGEIGQQHLRLDFVADESSHPPGKVDFDVGEEERTGAILRRVLPAVVWHLVRDLCIRLGLACLVVGEPLLPGRLRLGQVLHKAIAVVARVALVDQRKEREGRFVGPAAPCLRIDVREELTREIKVVPESAVMEEHKFLEVFHRDAAVSVDAAGTPGDVPRNEKVRSQIDAMADAGVQEIVKLGHLLRTDRRAVLRIA